MPTPSAAELAERDLSAALRALARVGLTVDDFASPGRANRRALELAAEQSALDLIDEQDGVDAIRAERDHLRSEIDALADGLLGLEILPRNESAVECALRALRSAFGTGNRDSLKARQRLSEAPESAASAQELRPNSAPAAAAVTSGSRAGRTR